MPTLGSLLDGSMRKVGSLYGVVPAISDGAASGASSIQPNHLAALPVEKFTPGGVALTDANIVASIEAARLYAVTQKGGRVIIPHGPHSGAWAPPAATTIPGGSVLSGSKKAAVCFRGSFLPLWLEGVPGAGFIIPADSDVGVYFMSPDDTGGSPGFGVHYDGGMRNLILTPGAVSMVCDAFRINAAVNCRFEKLQATSFNGAAGGNYGSGMRNEDDWAGGNGNSQFCTFDHVKMDTNQHDFVMSKITRSRFIHADSQGPLRRSWLLSGSADVAIYNSGLQCSGLTDSLVELTGTGFVALIDCYTEGSNPGAALFKSHSITSNSWIAIVRYVSNDADMGYVVHADDANNTTHVLVEQCFFPTGVKALKAHPINDGSAGPYHYINNVHFDAADALDPSKFDINDYAKRRLYVARGGKVFAGGEQITASPFRLAAFAEGSEPGVADAPNYGSPVEGQLTYNTSTHRPRVYGSSAYHDVALTDDPKGVTGLLKPYAACIIDPRVYKLRSVISGNLDTIADVLHPTALASAPSSGRRPTFNASSDAFGGKPSFTCDHSTDKMLQLTLGTAVPIGAYPGIFVVARATTSGLDTGFDRPAVTAIGPLLWIAGRNDQTYPDWGSQYQGSVAHQYQSVSNVSLENQYGHALLFNVEPYPPGYGFDGGQRGTFYADAIPMTGFISSPNVGDPGGIATAITGAYIGAGGSSSGQAANIEIAYLAIMNQPLPPSVTRALWDLASAEWSLGL